MEPLTGLQVGGWHAPGLEGEMPLWMVGRHLRVQILLIRGGCDCGVRSETLATAHLTPEMGR